MKNKFFTKRYFIFIILVCCTLYSCNWDNPPKASQEKKLETCWESSTPEEQGMDSQLLLQMLQKIQKEEINIRSIVVVRNHRLVLESYIYPYTRDIPHNTKSASKSIVSALTGIALREKWLESLDRTLESYFPQYFTGQKDPRKKKINLRHLLMMSTGLKIREQTQDTADIYASPDPVKSTLEFPMSGEPGQQFNYLTPLTLVMAEILKKTSGKSLEEMADTYLFNPLGIQHVAWKEVPQGYYFTDAAMRPLDMAKFGVLYLDKGKWQGKQVVPVKWVEESTKNQLPGQESRPYGYWWWRGASIDMFMALGWGGQGICVMPEENMVIVTTAADPMKAHDMVFDFIIPAVKSSKPLPPNPQGVKALQEMINRLQSTAATDRQTVPLAPAIVKEINGKTYSLEPNIAGLVSMAFHFSEKSCRLTLGTEKGSAELDVGLDNVCRISDSGRYGERPQHNKMALKGRWKNSNTFFLDFHSIGRPEQALMDICFKGEDLTIDVQVVGTDMKFSINGKAKNGKPSTD